MTAEEEMWLRLCLRLHKTPSEAREQITHIDFLRFWHIIQKEQDESDKRDWYDAQTAYQMWCVPFMVWGKTPPATVTIKNFLLKFTAGDGGGKPETRMDDTARTESEELAKEIAVKTDMAMWAGALGVPLPGQPLPADDGTPVMSMLPPKLDGMNVPPGVGTDRDGRPSRVNSPNPGPNTVPGGTTLPPAGFVPRGKGKRKRG